MLKTHGYLEKSGQQLRAEGFRYDAQNNLYKKEPFQPAALMNCFMAAGRVKRSLINMCSFPTEHAADDRFAEYTSNLERQLKAQVKAEWNNYTTKSRTNTKVIRVYDLVGQNFMIAVYRMSLQVIDKHILFIAAFSRKYYPDANSVVKELGK